MIQIFRICRHGKVPYRRFNSPEASAHVQVQRKYGWEPSNRVCGARGAAAHACAPGLSTGRRLMPMPARCGAAAPCRGAATVRRSPHTRRVLRRVLLGRGCLCGAHRARATASTTKRLHACACEGADENSWQSRPRHACASSAFHTPSSRLHAPCAIQQQATVMVLLDASAIARNVGRDLVFAASRRAACSHSDLGCANYGAEALPA